MDDYERDLETCRLHGWTLDELEEARAVRDAWWATRKIPKTGRRWQKMWPHRPMPYVICEAEVAIPLPA
ncbi:hypothetical protein G8767_19990 [Rhodococcus sp. IC4_135]|uniref:hypothetical protein n=1 Tax=Rhodococcus sp. IC4_135 TaxID=2715537 RepID=UPI00141DB939|nr:hypothetical protein [Rhodococcus sp. IC4_135]